MKRKNIINQKGITLIALIITVIVLLILAGVVLSLSIGERGIFSTAKAAKVKTEYTAAKEIVELKLMDIQSDCIVRKVEYNIVEIANSMKEDDQITIEKYYNSNVALVKNGISENLVNLKAILVSANSYPKYKFLIGESGEIERVATQNVTDTTNLEEDKRQILESIDDYETKLGIDIGPRENKNIFKELEENNKTVNDLAEYGMTVKRSGKNEYAGYNELYHLGQGSGAGINRNTFTLTIDYDTLCSKLDSKLYKGITTEFSSMIHSERSGYTPWIYSKILIKYDDDTEKEIKTETIYANNKIINEEKALTLMFETNKKVSKIQIIIDMYDSDWGSARGCIKNIELIK